MLFVNGRARGGKPSSQRSGEPAKEIHHGGRRGRGGEPLGIDHLTIFIVHFGILVIGDCLYIIDYLGARRSVAGTGTWDLGAGTWMLGSGCWDLGAGI